VLWHIDRIVKDRREREAKDRARTATPLLEPRRPTKEEAANKVDGEYLVSTDRNQ
jgi:hypothetical protein